MNAVKQDVEKLVQKELESANQRFPMFRSDHEGAAVILEEIEETHSEMLDMELNYKSLWQTIKENFINTASYAELIFDDAINLACEAIQIAAMAQKFIDSQKERENQHE